MHWKFKFYEKIQNTELNLKKLVASKTEYASLIHLIQSNKQATKNEARKIDHVKTLLWI